MTPEDKIKKITAAIPKLTSEHREFLMQGSGNNIDRSIDPVFEYYGYEDDEPGTRSRFV